MKLAWAAIALLGVRFLVSAWFYPAQDADLAWQHVLGDAVLRSHAIPSHLGPETFTAAGSAWVPQEWLFSVAVAWAFDHGRFGWLAILNTLAAVAALTIVALHARRRGATAFPITAVVIFAGIAMMQSYGVRAQVFSWPLFAALLLVLELEGNAIFLAIPLVAVWANVHASAVLAPPLVAAWTFGTFIEDRKWTPRVERSAVVTTGTLLAIFLTPFFWKLPLYALTLFNSPWKSAISEWQAPDPTYYAFALGLLPLLAGAIWLGIAAPEKRWRDGMVFAVMLAMAFMAVRSVSLCALALAPMVGARLGELIPRQRRINALFEERGVQAILAAATLASAFFIAVSLARSPAISGEALPKRAILTLALEPGTHRVYCEDFAWCSLALQHANLRTFIDGRCDPFPLAVWNDYNAVQKLAPSWSGILDNRGVDAVIAGTGNPIAQALTASAAWRLRYRDGRYVLFVRSAQHTAQR